MAWVSFRGFEVDLVDFSASLGTKRFDSGGVFFALTSGLAAVGGVVTGALEAFLARLAAGGWIGLSSAWTGCRGSAGGLGRRGDPFRGAGKA